MNSVMAPSSSLRQLILRAVAVVLIVCRHCTDTAAGSVTSMAVPNGLPSSYNVSNITSTLDAASQLALQYETRAAQLDLNMAARLAELTPLLAALINNCNDYIGVMLRIQTDLVYSLGYYLEAIEEFLAQSRMDQVVLIQPEFFTSSKQLVLWRFPWTYSSKGDTWLTDHSTDATTSMISLDALLTSMTSTAGMEKEEVLSYLQRYNTSQTTNSTGSPANDSDSDPESSALDDLLSSLDPSALQPQDNITLNDTLGGMWGTGEMFPLPTVMMYYRRDVFEAQGWKLPATWPDLVDLAQQINGTVDLDGDGDAEYAMCIDHKRVCKSNFIVMAIAAPMLQTDSTECTGVFFDPATFSSLVATPAMQQALAIYRQLVQYAVPVPANESCRSYDPLFNAQQCLIAINFDQVQSSYKAPAVQGKVGTALAPGSALVYNRSTGAMAACTAASCPYAQEEALRNGTTALVNRVPFTASLDWALVDSPQSTATMLAKTTAMSVGLTQKLHDWTLLLTQSLDLAPDSADQGSASSGSSSSGDDTGSLAYPGYGTYNTTGFVNKGYDEEDVQRFLAAYWLAQANTAADICIRGAPYYRVAIAEAAYKVLQGLPVANATALLQARFSTVLKASGNSTQLMWRYWLNIGYQPPTNSSISGGNSSAPPSRMPPWMVETNSKAYLAIILGVSLPLSMLLILALLAAWLAVRVARKKHKSLFGKVLAPGAGPDTTLLLTDIQNSTVLWESLPALVMDQALRVHHTIMRNSLAKWSGYESATEGDAFILAFHSPLKAAWYAAEVQRALLLAEAWPQELLETQDGGALWLVPCPDNAVSAMSEVCQELATLCSREALATPSARDKELLALRCTPTPTSVLPREASRPAIERLLSRNSQRHNDLRGYLDCPDALAVPQDTPYTAPADAFLPAKDLKPHSHGSSSGGGDGGGGDCQQDQQATKPRPRPDTLELSTSTSLGLAARRTWRPAKSEDFSNALINTSAGSSAPSALGSPAVGGFGRSLSSGLGGAFGGGLGGSLLHQAQAQPQVLCFRGLRVRMGIHAGCSDASEVSTNAATCRTQYSGTFMSLAKAVCDAAHGGQVLLSDAACQRLNTQQLQSSCLLVCMGEHSLGDTLCTTTLYQLLPYGLACRLSQQDPPRTQACLSPGLSHAPVGHATIVFANVAGAQTLLKWNPEMARAALATFHRLAAGIMEQYRGYVVEMVDGLCLAAFQSPAQALVWALQLKEAMVVQDWPEALTQHELCEDIIVTHILPGGELASQPLMRGLRLKVGLDVGKAQDSVNAVTGRVAYRGRVMNRAARIAAKACTGQVLCSLQAWRQAQSAELIRSCEVSATSLGAQSFKGVMEKIEVMQCILKGQVASEADALAAQLTGVQKPSFVQLLYKEGDGSSSRQSRYSDDTGTWGSSSSSYVGGLMASKAADRGTARQPLHGVAEHSPAGTGWCTCGAGLAAARNSLSAGAASPCTPRRPVEGGGTAAAGLGDTTPGQRSVIPMDTAACLTAAGGGAGGSSKGSSEGGASSSSSSSVHSPGPGQGASSAQRPAATLEGGHEATAQSGSAAGPMLLELRSGPEAVGLADARAAAVAMAGGVKVSAGQGGSQGEWDERIASLPGSLHADAAGGQQKRGASMGCDAMMHGDPLMHRL